jgi:hypothetical protein
LDDIKKEMMRNQSHLCGVVVSFKKNCTWLNKYITIDDGGWFVRNKDDGLINVPKAHTTDEEGKLKWFVLAYFDSHPGGVNVVVMTTNIKMLPSLGPTLAEERLLL